MSYYEENYSEWLNNFSVERQEDNLFLIKNHIANTFTIATNFNIKNCSYTGRIFNTVENLESALRIFERVKNEMSANKKVGVMP